MSELTLQDLGERRIIAEVLAPRYSSGTRFGDDCASLPLPAGDQQVLIATTDPCPPPMAGILGFDDLYYTGWLLATLNLSDLAAAGATPAGLLTSLMLPATTPLWRMERLLDGIDDCCARVSTRVLGGNLKEAPQLDVSATALGFCDAGHQLHRQGAQPGDALVIVGDLGEFWAGALGYMSGLIDQGDQSHPLMQNVLTPLPKVTVMRDLAASKTLAAAMDNSDGLYPSLVQLAEDNDLGIVIDADAIEFTEPVVAMANALDLHPMRLGLGWGDWQIVAACGTDRLKDAQEVARAAGMRLRSIGRLHEGRGVTLRVDGAEGSMMPLDSQRFVRDSWFSSGLQGYIDTLREAPLITPNSDQLSQ